MKQSELHCPTLYGYPLGAKDCDVAEVYYDEIPFFMCMAHGMTWHKLGHEEKEKRTILESKGFKVAEQTWREKVS